MKVLFRAFLCSSGGEGQRVKERKPNKFSLRFVVLYSSSEFQGKKINNLWNSLDFYVTCVYLLYY